MDAHVRIAGILLDELWIDDEDGIQGDYLAANRLIMEFPQLAGWAPTLTAPAATEVLVYDPAIGRITAVQSRDGRWMWQGGYCNPTRWTYLPAPPADSQEE